MLALATDENFNNDIIRGVLRRKPDLNLVRVQDVGLSGADDLIVLEWTAQEGRVLFTHDASTMTHHAYERVRTGKRMPGVFEVNREVPIAQASKTFYCWRNAASKASGKVKCGICRCGERKGNGPNVVTGFYNSTVSTGRLNQ
jgi:Domain of unknown function (DUF5615)